MENLLVPISQSKTQEPSDSASQLIREWLFRFGVNFEKDVAPVLPLWLEAFAGMDAAILERLFRRALKTCKFFPKVAEILAPIQKAEETAIPESAELAWQHVLECRRVYWDPDMPGGFSRGMPKLSPRVDRAARAAGVFRDHETVEALHVWAKKKFIESFTRWDEAGESQNLLPDGELKNLLAGCAKNKALPPPQPSFHELHARGLNYSKDVVIRSLGPQVAIRYAIWDSEEQRQEACLSLEEKETSPAALENIRRQKAALAAKGF